MDRRAAWQEMTEGSGGGDDCWTLNQLSDQFQRAVSLCGLSEEALDADDGSDVEHQDEDVNIPHHNDDCNNDHNRDVHHHNADNGEEASHAAGFEGGSRKVSEPYKNKYTSRILLVEMKAALSRQFDRLTPQQQKQAVGLRIEERLLAVSLQLGLIAVAVQEPSTGEEHFTHIVQLLEERAAHPRCVSLLISALNQLGILWAERYEYSKAKTELLRASEVYKKYKENNSFTAPVAVADLFLKVRGDEVGSSPGDQKSGDGIVTVADEQDQVGGDALQGSEDLGCWSDFEQLHTYTLYYLAQVCGHLEEGADAARYCHATLHRQLADTIVFEPLDWSKNAANLSSYYSACKNYKMARYLLCSAWTMLTNNTPPSNSQQDVQSRYQSVKAEIENLIGNYAVKLLQDSQALLEGGDDAPPPSSADDAEQPSDAAAAQWEQKKFVGLDPEVVESMESRIPATIITDYEGARVAFLVGLEHLEKVSSHFTLQDHASRHTEVIQSISRLYQGLAAFEPQQDRKCKMHKRRVDMLNHLLAELNPQYYLQVCRQLRYELAESYAMMASCKEPPPNNHSEVTPQQWTKITGLTVASIENYKLFLKSFKPLTGEEALGRYPEEAERAALVAHFHMGRLWNRIKTTSTSQAVVNITNAINCFKELVDYVRRYPESKEKVSEELQLCREMMELLPLKLAQLQASR